MCVSEIKVMGMTESSDDDRERDFIRYIRSHFLKGTNPSISWGEIEQMNLLEEFLFTFSAMQPLEIRLEVEMGLKLWADH